MEFYNRQTMGYNGPTYAGGSSFPAYTKPPQRGHLIHEVGQYGFRLGMCNYPWYVDARAGDIVISDKGNDRIQAMTSKGDVHKTFEAYGGIGHTANKFVQPSGVAVCDSTGTNMVIADTGNRRVNLVKVSGEGFDMVHSFGQQDFIQPMGVEFDIRRNVILVTDYMASRVTLHELNGLSHGPFRDDPQCPLKGPADVAISEQGQIFVSDSGNDSIQVFDKSGNFIGRLGERGSGEGQFIKPWGVCIDRKGNLLVADEGNNRVQMFSSDLRYICDVVNDIHTPKGISVGIHEQLVVTCGDPRAFVKIYNYI
ncbi:unnamed protein product [Owenia fusiformis]|uniref:Uncharacterized protein n=1 Tax=Owenia fusiformis TaxID=6347 RepID=A0A8S4NRJ2_OWEFU|nr:unnamed protein product [Owenia fusiformis]